MPFRNRKKAPRKRHGRMRRRRVHRQGKASKIQSLIVRSPGVICPDRTFVKMQYLETVTQVLGTPGSNIGSIAWNVNAVHALAPIGFTAMTNMYRFYRVRGAKVKISGVNMEAFPINVVLVPLNITASVTLAYIQDLTQNAFARWKQVSPKGGLDKVTLSNYISTKKIVGTKASDFDDSYASVSTTNPANLWYFFLGVYPTLSSDTFNASTGLHFEARITMYVEWYERNYLIS